MEEPNRAGASHDRSAVSTTAPAMRTTARILGVALSLVILGMLIRARMTGVLILDSLGERLTNPLALVHQVVVGAYWDMVVVLAITLPFLGLTYALRRSIGAL